MTGRSKARVDVDATAATRAPLDELIATYETELAPLAYYSHALAWWTARYSRGDSIQALAAAYPRIVDEVEATQAAERAREPSAAPLFLHENTYAGLYRDALVIAALALCLRVPVLEARRLLSCCQRGDRLLEAVAAAIDPALAVAAEAPAFARFFDGLYAAVAAGPAERPPIVRDYLRVWCDERMRGFGFKLAYEEIGYWCFEAAGIVAALGIDDSGFRDHPHYPDDLVAFYRADA